MNSLRNRLSFGLIVSLMVLLLAQWWLSSSAIENLLEKQLLDQLQQDSEALLAGVEFDTADALALSTTGLVPAYQQPYSGTYFALQHQAEIRYSRSLWDADFTLPTPGGPQALITRQSGPDGQYLLVHARTALLRPSGQARPLPHGLDELPTRFVERHPKGQPAPTSLSPQKLRGECAPSVVHESTES